MSLPNLNLLNFELPQTRNCKFVLTSPRSLKACRKAGIKPIDLLYKSLNEVEKQLGGKKEGVEEVYQAYELERQKKLKMCRNLRNDFILKGMPGKYDLKTLTRVSPKIKRKAISMEFDGKMNQENLKTSPMNFKSPHYGKDDVISENDKLETVKNVLSIPMLKCANSDGKNSVDSISEIDKLSILTMDSLGNNLNKINTSNSNETLKDELPLIEPIKKGVHFDNIHNNNLNKIIDKRSNSMVKKIREKKMMKALEFKRMCNSVCEQYADPDYSLFKYKQVIENSLERELREQEVHRVQRELDEGLERWQDHILILQWFDSLRAQEQASKELEMKVERLRRRSRSKNILHTMNYNKVKRDEDIKAELLRRFIEDKEKRIVNLHKQRERVIWESKTRAQNIADLKEQIRSILLPETFDKKVSKYGFQKRVLNTRTTSQKTMHSSHIRFA